MFSYISNGLSTNIFNSKIPWLFGITALSFKWRSLSYCDKMYVKDGMYVNYQGISKKNKYSNIRNLQKYDNLNTTGFYGNCGEDASFLVRNDRYIIFGVADGVGGWTKKGIDPSIFSGNLVKYAAINASHLLHKNSTDTSIILEPLDIMSRAYNDLIEKTPNAYGSSTACFVVFDCETNKIKIANLGDSGFFIYHSDSKYFESIEQCHYYNCPYQLSLIPSLCKSTSLSDKPRDAILYEFELKPNDLFIIATDGVWDNLDIQNSHPIAYITNGKLLSPSTLDDFCNELFTEIIQNSKWNESKVRCPESPKGGFYGGKIDDITFMVVGVINNDQTM